MKSSVSVIFDSQLPASIRCWRYYPQCKRDWRVGLHMKKMKFSFFLSDICADLEVFRLVCAFLWALLLSTFPTSLCTHRNINIWWGTVVEMKKMDSKCAVVEMLFFLITLKYKVAAVWTVLWVLGGGGLVPGSADDHLTATLKMYSSKHEDESLFIHTCSNVS